MPEPPFAVRSVRFDRDMFRIEIHGGLDVGTASLVDRAGASLVADLPADPGMYGRIDLAGLTFCDTAGLDALSAAAGSLV